MAADSLDTLSRLTGMSRAAITDCVSEVQANRKKAEACREHKLTPYVPFSRIKRTCENCGAWFTFDQAYRMDKDAEALRKFSDDLGRGD